MLRETETLTKLGTFMMVCHHLHPPTADVVMISRPRSWRIHYVGAMSVM